MKIRVVKYLWKGEINLLMIYSCVQLNGNKYPKYIFVDTNLLFSNSQMLFVDGLDRYTTPSYSAIRQYSKC